MYLNADLAPTGVVVHMVIDPYLTSILVELDPAYKAYVRTNGSVVVYLWKALYGTIEASKLWYDVIVNVIRDLRFAHNPFDKCVFNR